MAEKQFRTMMVPVSLGELVDKITILKIKCARITDPEKLNHIEHEYRLLLDLWTSGAPYNQEFSDLSAALQTTNESLWQVEDEIREHEHRGDFGPSFVDLARAIYRFNDRRAAIKREINQRFNSDIVEEKSYTT